ECDEGLPRDAPRRRPARLPLPLVVLPLKQVAVLRRRDELLRLAAGVAVIRLGPAGECDHRAVVKIVVPEAVEAGTALADRTHEAGVLWFVLRDDHRAAAARTLAHALSDRRQDVLGGAIVDLLCCIEPQPIEVELVDPVARVRDEELTHRPGVG